MVSYIKMSSMPTTEQVINKSVIITASQWWLSVLLGCLPLALVMRYLQPLDVASGWSMAAFVLGLSCVFLHLKMFNRFKHAVIATGHQKLVAARWQHFIQVRRQALWLSLVPAWLAVPAWLVGLEAIPSGLLVLASCALLWLYRVPRQLW